MDWRKKIDDEILRQGRNRKEVSLSAGLGATYVRDLIERSAGGARFDAMTKIAHALGYGPEWLTMDDDDKPPASHGQAEMPLAPWIEDAAPPALPAGIGDFPIYPTALMGDGCTMTVRFHAFERMPAPSVLAGVHGAYGLRVLGSGMEPAYNQGDLLFIHPYLPPQRDTDVLLLGAMDETVTAKLGHLVGHSNDNFEIARHKPPVLMTVRRSEWPMLHRVVGKFCRS